MRVCRFVVDGGGKNGVDDGNPNVIKFNCVGDRVEEFQRWAWKDSMKERKGEKNNVTLIQSLMYRSYNSGARWGIVRCENIWALTWLTNKFAECCTNSQSHSHFLAQLLKLSCE